MIFYNLMLYFVCLGSLALLGEAVTQKVLYEGMYCTSPGCYISDAPSNNLDYLKYNASSLIEGKSEKQTITMWLYPQGSGKQFLFGVFDATIVNVYYIHDNSTKKAIYQLEGNGTKNNCNTMGDFKNQWVFLLFAMTKKRFSLNIYSKDQGLLCNQPYLLGNGTLFNFGIKLFDTCTKIILLLEQGTAWLGAAQHVCLYNGLGFSEEQTNFGRLMGTTTLDVLSQLVFNDEQNETSLVHDLFDYHNYATVESKDGHIDNLRSNHSIKFNNSQLTFKAPFKLKSAFSVNYQFQLADGVNNFTALTLRNEAGQLLTINHYILDQFLGFGIFLNSNNIIQQQTNISYLGKIFNCVMNFFKKPGDETNTILFQCQSIIQNLLSDTYQIKSQKVGIDLQGNILATIGSHDFFSIKGSKGNPGQWILSKIKFWHGSVMPYLIFPSICKNYQILNDQDQCVQFDKNIHHSDSLIYMNVIPLCAAKCKQCSSGNPANCISCNGKRIQAPNCQCPKGTFEDGVSSDCPSAIPDFSVQQGQVEIDCGQNGGSGTTVFVKFQRYEQTPSILIGYSAYDVKYALSGSSFFSIQLIFLDEEKAQLKHNCGNSFGRIKVEWMTYRNEDNYVELGCSWSKTIPQIFPIQQKSKLQTLIEQGSELLCTILDYLTEIGVNQDVDCNYIIVNASQTNTSVSKYACWQIAVIPKDWKIFRKAINSEQNLKSETREFKTYLDHPIKLESEYSLKQHLWKAINYIKLNGKKRITTLLTIRNCSKLNSECTLRTETGGSESPIDLNYTVVLPLIKCPNDTVCSVIDGKPFKYTQEPCHYACKSCAGNDSKYCLECDESQQRNSSLVLETGKCPCNEGYEEVDGKQICEKKTIQCPKGQFLSNGTCANCSQPCISCEIHQQNCTECNYQANFERTTNNTCQCRQGFELQDKQCVESQISVKQANQTQASPNPLKKCNLNITRVRLNKQNCIEVILQSDCIINDQEWSNLIEKINISEQATLDSRSNQPLNIKIRNSNFTKAIAQIVPYSLTKNITIWVNPKQTFNVSDMIIKLHSKSSYTINLPLQNSMDCYAYIEKVVLNEKGCVGVEMLSDCIINEQEWGKSMEKIIVSQQAILDQQKIQQVKIRFVSLNNSMALGQIVPCNISANNQTIWFKVNQTFNIYDKRIIIQSNKSYSITLPQSNSLIYCNIFSREVELNEKGCIGVELLSDCGINDSEWRKIMEKIVISKKALDSDPPQPAKIRYVSSNSTKVLGQIVPCNIFEKNVTVRFQLNQTFNLSGCRIVFHSDSHYTIANTNGSSNIAKLLPLKQLKMSEDLSQTYNIAKETSVSQFLQIMQILSLLSIITNLSQFTTQFLFVDSQLSPLTYLLIRCLGMNMLPSFIPEQDEDYQDPNSEFILAFSYNLTSIVKNTSYLGRFSRVGSHPYYLQLSQLSLAILFFFAVTTTILDYLVISSNRKRRLQIKFLYFYQHKLFESNQFQIVSGLLFCIYNVQRIWFNQFGMLSFFLSLIIFAVICYHLISQFMIIRTINQQRSYYETMLKSRQFGENRVMLSTEKAFKDELDIQMQLTSPYYLQWKPQTNPQSWFILVSQVKKFIYPLVLIAFYGKTEIQMVLFIIAEILMLIYRIYCVPDLTKVGFISRAVTRILIILFISSIFVEVRLYKLSNMRNVNQQQIIGKWVNQAYYTISFCISSLAIQISVWLYFLLSIVFSLLAKRLSSNKVTTINQGSDQQRQGAEQLQINS